MDETNKPPIDDMKEDVGNWPHLKDQLTVCQEVLGEFYTRSDRLAIEHQGRHRIITLIAAICGTVAVFLAILSLAQRFAGPLVLVGEILAVLVAVVAVALGVYSALQPRWLSHRHHAERCRLLKFHYLTDPVLWGGDTAAAARRKEQLVEDARKMRTTRVHDWMELDDIPDIIALPKGDYSPGVMRELVDYYTQRRLDGQIAYFQRRMSENNWRDRLTRHIPATLFFISVVAALGHFAHDLYRSFDVEPGHALADVSIVLIIFAAFLPVVGAGVRTVRAAFEFARNTVRYRAKLVTLRHFREKLPTENDPALIFPTFWHCEQILESEHREWLRLMIDAEWFG